MANRQDHRGLSVVAVQRDVAAVAKADQPFPVLQFHVFVRVVQFPAVA